MNITELGSGISYYFWVSTVKDGQESGKSPMVSVLTAAPVDPTPGPSGNNVPVVIPKQDRLPVIIPKQTEIPVIIPERTELPVIVPKR
jgi:hypothetical protein